MTVKQFRKLCNKWNARKYGITIQFFYRKMPYPVFTRNVEVNDETKTIYFKFDVNDNCSPWGNSFLTVNDFSKMFEDKKFRDYNITIVGIDGKISGTSEVYESWIDFGYLGDVVVLYSMWVPKGGNYDAQKIC